MIEKTNKELIIKNQLTLDHNKYAAYTETTPNGKIKPTADTVTQKLIEVEYEDEIAEYEAEIEAEETGEPSKIQFESIPQKKDPPKKEVKKPVITSTGDYDMSFVDIPEFKDVIPGLPKLRVDYGKINDWQQEYEDRIRRHDSICKHYPENAFKKQWDTGTIDSHTDSFTLLDTNHKVAYA